jgi:hypothetical protein
MLKAQRWGKFIITIELILYDNRRLVIEYYLSLFFKNSKKERAKTLFKMDFS